ncbi:MAG TPA: TlpA disulfide reductase family protein [Candidatus Elarobacter sp.]|jgi:thiol-disulfide isomerase/thioredoxin|nr:TlpA disulfide reductase family protein [Candidatus Elarobacter sp.]
MSRSAAKAKAPLITPRTIVYAVIAIIVIAIVVFVGLASRNQVVPENATKAVGQANLKVGDTAPEFKITTNAGPFDLAAVNTPVLLEVFAPWCPHCQREAPILNDLSTKYAGKLAIVAVSGDAVDYEHNGPESQANVNAFAAQFQTKYPIAFDQNLTVAGLYLHSGFPSIHLIDKNKKITFQQEGEVTEAQLVKAINATLSGTGT